MQFDNPPSCSSAASSASSDSDEMTPTQLLSLAIKKRRALYERRERDFRRELLHTGMIQALCKALGETRAKRRRSRHRKRRRGTSPAPSTWAQHNFWIPPPPPPPPPADEDDVTGAAYAPQEEDATVPSVQGYAAYFAADATLAPRQEGNASSLQNGDEEEEPTAKRRRRGPSLVGDELTRDVYGAGDKEELFGTYFRMQRVETATTETADQQQVIQQLDQSTSSLSSDASSSSSGSSGSDGDASSLQDFGSMDWASLTIAQQEAHFNLCGF